MNGSFAVGNVTTPPPTPSPGSKPVTSEVEAPAHLGPGFTITLKTTAGKAVKSMRTGTYTVVVRDRSRIHNAHLVGAGLQPRDEAAHLHRLADVEGEARKGRHAALPLRPALGDDEGLSEDRSLGVRRGPRADAVGRPRRRPLPHLRLRRSVRRRARPGPA